MPLDINLGTKYGQKYILNLYITGKPEIDALLLIHCSFLIL